MPDGARELPTIAYGDIADGLPFADGYFDVVYSQVAWLYFGRKIDVLRETIRVLRGDGLAKIDADELKPGLPPEYARLVEIWKGGTLCRSPTTWRGTRWHSRSPRRPLHPRFNKVASFGTDLEPVFEIDLATINPNWDGIKCVYRSQPTSSPARDPPAADDRGT